VIGVDFLAKIDDNCSGFVDAHQPVGFGLKRWKVRFFFFKQHFFARLAKNFVPEGFGKVGSLKLGRPLFFATHAMGFLVAFVKDVPFVTGRTRFVGTLGVGALDGLVLRLAELFITHFAGGHLGLLFVFF
jgi:hypothetical protein